MAGDLPEGRTVHGDPGAPPPNTDMTQFKMHIPVRPDERQGGSDAGQGKEKIGRDKTELARALESSKSSYQLTSPI